MFYGKIMNHQSNKKVEPLCRFGPGGDFVWSWRPEPPEIERPYSRPILELFRCIIETFTALLGPDLINEQAKQNYGGSLIIRSKEIVSNAFKDRARDEFANTEKNPAPQINTLFPREPMLFPDLRGTGIKPWHKPKHGIRAHRRTAKKRPSVSLSGQGTLFDADVQSARTA
jgi:hypothetical protein